MEGWLLFLVLIYYSCDYSYLLNNISLTLEDTIIEYDFFLCMMGA